MNAHDLLKWQHDEVEQKFRQFMRATGEAQENIGKDILTDLTAHSETEEELYYPELERAGEEAVAMEFQAEHAAAKTLITKLSMMGVDDDEYVPTMKALMEDILSHAKEEEAEMPEAARRLGREKLMQMGTKMEQRFNELKESTFKRFWAAIT